MTYNLELLAGNVKAAMKNMGAASSDLYKLPVDSIKEIPGFNVRTETPEYLAHIETLTQSMLANGYYQDKPIAVFIDDAGIPRIIDGYSRMRAVHRAIIEGAPIETVPCVVKPRGTTMEDLTVALVVSNSGKHLTPYETGLVVKRLIDMGLAEKEVARRLGFTVPYINDLLTLVAAPNKVRKMVVDGKVSATTAIAEVKRSGKAAADTLEKAQGVATAAGKGKVTAKHLRAPKAAPVKLQGTVAANYQDGLSVKVVFADAQTSIETGDIVLVTIVKKGEL